MDNKNLPSEKKKRKPYWLLLLLLLILLFGWQKHLSDLQKAKQEEEQAILLEAKRKKDSLKNLNLDSIRLDSIRLATITIDSIRLDSIIADFVTRDSIRVDSIRMDSIRLDSLAKLDSLTKKTKKSFSLKKPKHSSSMQPASVSMSLLDSIPPQGEITPIGGRYFESVLLKLNCFEVNCKTKIVLNSSKDTLATSQLKLENSGTLSFAFEDSLGNQSSWLTEDYTVVKASSLCPKGMVPIGRGKSGYCIDQYEWPNKKGAFPKGSASLLFAQVSCQKVGKNLCSKLEWQGACSKDQSKYPYGQSYNNRNCNTKGTRPFRSGHKDNCRSWHGVYDMTGNLWEWTNTPHEKRKNYNYAVGGNWAGRDGATCKSAKYSFFPQNEYPILGFRCCAAQKL